MVALKARHEPNLRLGPGCGLIETPQPPIDRPFQPLMSSNEIPDVFRNRSPTRIGGPMTPATGQPPRCTAHRGNSQGDAEDGAEWSLAGRGKSHALTKHRSGLG